MSKEDRKQLSTTAARSMTVHALRLLPGDDLLNSIESFAVERGIEAGVILTCVGSTSKTTLRPAGQPKLKVFDGKFEIVSLTGTFSTESSHIHMSISDDKCNVFGGHVVEGCEVRTTAEIAIGEIRGLSFERRQDERSGYSELFIEESAAEQILEQNAGQGASSSHRRLAAKVKSSSLQGGDTKEEEIAKKKRVQEEIAKKKEAANMKVGFYAAALMLVLGCCWEYFIIRKIKKSPPMY
jgi:predicted DNA-binding protein with PD1-like motif